jgi:hypothetical protein
MDVAEMRDGTGELKDPGKWCSVGDTGRQEASEYRQYTTGRASVAPLSEPDSPIDGFDLFLSSIYMRVRARSEAVWASEVKDENSALGTVRTESGIQE